MNSNIKIFLLCPVPEEQKPINQYIGIKENFFTSWTTFSPTRYEKKILQLFFITFFFTCCLQVSHFQGLYYVIEWSLENMFGSSYFLSVFFLLVLYQWLEMGNRFQQARLFYEEASWYDGQMWEKPLAVIKNDNLIRSQKIQPIIQRIQKTVFQLISFTILSSLVLQFIVS
jgi:hypothetical protein